MAEGFALKVEHEEVITRIRPADHYEVRVTHRVFSERAGYVLETVFFDTYRRDENDAEKWEHTDSYSFNADIVPAVIKALCMVIPVEKLERIAQEAEGQANQHSTHAAELRQYAADRKAATA